VAQSGSSAPLCDSTAFRTPVRVAEDTLRMWLVAGAGLRELPRPWADELLDVIGSRVALPQPLVLDAYGGGTPDSAVRVTGSAVPETVAPAASAELIVVVHKDGRLTARQTVRSLAPSLDASVLAAIRAVDSTRMLPPYPSKTRGDSVVMFLSVATLDPPRQAAARPLTRLVLPRFVLSSPVLPVPGLRGPRYPVDLRNRGVMGEVAMEYVVDETGAVSRGTLRVVRFSHPDFVRAVVTHLDSVRFRPATIAGCAVKQLVQQPFKFELTR
jgi:TonB family protein